MRMPLGLNAMYGGGRKYAGKVDFDGMRCMEPAVNMQAKWTSVGCDVWNRP